MREVLVVCVVVGQGSLQPSVRLGFEGLGRIAGPLSDVS